MLVGLGHDTTLTHATCLKLSQFSGRVLVIPVFKRQEKLHDMSLLLPFLEHCPELQLRNPEHVSAQELDASFA